MGTRGLGNSMTGATAQSSGGILKPPAPIASRPAQTTAQRIPLSYSTVTDTYSPAVTVTAMDPWGRGKGLSLGG